MRPQLLLRGPSWFPPCVTRGLPEAALCSRAPPQLAVGSLREVWAGDGRVWGRGLTRPLPLPFPHGCSSPGPEQLLPVAPRPSPQDGSSQGGVLLCFIPEEPPGAGPPALGDKGWSGEAVSELGTHVCC